MIDAHVHLEKGDYSVEWIEQFIEYAVKRNLSKSFVEYCFHKLIGYNLTQDENRRKILKSGNYGKEQVRK